MPTDLSDPQSSIGAALVALGRLYTDATIVSDGLSTHLRTTHSDPPLHAALQRLQVWCGDFRHAMTNIETHTTERLRKAIADALPPLEST